MPENLDHHKIPSVDLPIIQDETKKISLLAVAIITKIQNKTFDPDELSDIHRRLCVRFLMYQTAKAYTLFEIAELFQVSRATVIRDKKIIRTEGAMAQLVLDESEIAIELKESAEKYATLLEKNGKYKDAWTVLKENMEMMQSLGYIKKAATEINMVGDFISFLNRFAKIRNGGHAVEKDGNGEDTSRFGDSRVSDLGTVLPGSS